MKIKILIIVAACFLSLQSLKVQTLTPCTIYYLESVFDDEDPQMEELFYVAQKVYEDKVGMIMEPVKIKLNKKINKTLDENQIKKEFPSLCRLFNYN